MREISVNELTRTILCERRGCQLDAENGRTVCREHIHAPAPHIEPEGRPGVMTRDQIIAAIKRWAVEHDGVPPRSTDWHHADAYWPCMTTVARVFGKWGDSLVAAGFDRDFHVRLRAARRLAALEEREPQAAASLGPPRADSATTASATPTAGRSSSRSSNAVHDAFNTLRQEIDRLERELLDDLYKEEAA